MRDHFVLAEPAADARSTTSRPLARLLDVTLRDGGFEVDFAWPLDLLSSVPQTLAPVGVDAVELGYIGGVPAEHRSPHAGVGANITPEIVAQARRGGATLAAMIHPTAMGTSRDLSPYALEGLGMIRLVYHPDWADAIAVLAAHARSLDLTVSVNIALASRYTKDELRAHALRIAEYACPDIVYLADTCGALRPDEVYELVSDLVSALDSPRGDWSDDEPYLSHGLHMGRGRGEGPQVGFHAHDFLTLAYANALAAAQAGATWLDCSLLGLGRGGGAGAGAGGGNLSTELMLLQHRLPDHDAGSGLGTLLDLRARIAQHASREPAALVAMVCGSLNLTPVEEAALRDFAANEDLDPDLAALWLATRGRRLDSYRVVDLQNAWHVAGSSSPVSSREVSTKVPGATCPATAEAPA